MQLLAALAGAVAGVALMQLARSVQSGPVRAGSESVDAAVDAASRRALLDALRRRDWTYEGNDLIARLQAGDATLLHEIEELARTTNDASRVAWLHSVLFLGTGDPRRLEQVFEARTLVERTTWGKMPDEQAIARGATMAELVRELSPDLLSWRDVVANLKLDEHLTYGQLAQVMLQIDRLARSDREEARELMESGFVASLTREELDDPSAHDRLVSLARECVLAGQPYCIGSLAFLSADATVATAATVLADARRPLELRGKVLKEVLLHRQVLRASSPELVRGMPKGDQPPDWQAWIEANRALVERAMALGRQG